MKYVTRASSVLVALLLLIAFAQGGSLGPVEAVVTLAEDDVLWTDSAGNDVAHVAPDTTAHFYIKDLGLHVPKSGTSTWSGQGALPGTVFSLPTGDIGVPGTTSTATYTLDAPGYNTTSPASTPLSEKPTVKVGTADAFVISFDVDAGSFTMFLNPGTDKTTTATFSFHAADSYASSTQRAKVTGTSDPSGEWLDIAEVAFGSATVAATSATFLGTLQLSSSTEALSAGDGMVWVQDGDTLVVTYYDADGNAIDSDSVTVDGVEPIFADVSPADGTVTANTFPQVSFNVTDLGSGLTDAGISLKIHDNIATRTAFPIADGFGGIFANPVSWQNDTTAGGFGAPESKKFTMVMTATDKAGNTATETVWITIDTTAPYMTGAVTGSDASEVVVTFYEALTAVASDGSDFTVAAAAAVGAVLDEDDKTKVTLTTGTPLAADETPAVKVVTSNVKDAAGNAVAADSTITATDGIGPTLTVAVDKDLAVADDVVTVTAASNERIAGGTSGLWITVAGPVGATNNKLLTVSSPVPHGFEGSITVVSGDVTGQYGVSVWGRDGANYASNLTDVSDEEIDVSDEEIDAVTGATTFTLGNGPIGDKNRDGVIDGKDIKLVGPNGETSAVGPNGETSTVTIMAVDATTRVVTASGLTPGTTKVSYSHVGSHVFEIDQSAPTAVVDQDEKTIQDTSPFLRMVWDEDEYTGDSYTTVTLTKAEMTMPDGTVQDLLASFVTTDNKEFLYAASGLALGDYELAVAATDTAANEGTLTAKFTIAKRTQTIGLRPGWNLISLADAPADGAIGSVMAGLEADIVLTYDPRAAGGWQSAVRDQAGWSGNLMTIDPKKGYWVHTDGFETLSVDVPGLTAGAAGLPPSYRLVAGWNLVGVGVPDLTTETRDADEYFSGLNWSRAYGYSNTANAFTAIVPDGITVDDAEIVVGHGYWIFLRVAGDLVP